MRKVPSELVSVLFDKTRGIPLYCEGLLRKMLKEQVIKVVDDLGQLNKGNQQQRKGTGKFFGFCKLSGFLYPAAKLPLFVRSVSANGSKVQITLLSNRPNREILVPDWLITSHVT